MSTKLIGILALSMASVLAQSGGYGGPEILSRATNASGARASTHAGFTFYTSLLGTYETGNLAASVDSNGKLIEAPTLAGIEADLGAYGRRSWRRTTVTLDYNGNFRHYTQNSFYDGSDHVVGVDVAVQPSRHVTYHWNTAGGTVSRFYGVPGVLTTQELASATNYSLFDNRATFAQSSVGGVYQKSARLSFSATGSGYVVRRRSSALVGLNGYSAQGSMSYRLTRTRTVGLGYGFSHYDYPGGFGNSNIHTLMVEVAQAFGRRWEASGDAGAAKISTVGIEGIVLDPITAALFGTATSYQVFNRDIIIGSGRAALIGNYRKSRIEFRAEQQPVAGNGVYLTSKQRAASATYTFIGMRSASFSVGGNYTNFSSIGQSQIGSFDYFSAGAGASYKFWRSVEATLKYDARNIQINQTNGLQQVSYRIAFGLSWHPGEFPVALW